jgi:hypothetical protein
MNTWTQLLARSLETVSSTFHSTFDNHDIAHDVCNAQLYFVKESMKLKVTEREEFSESQNNVVWHWDNNNNAHYNSRGARTLYERDLLLLGL